jgi:hypothetical protein
MIYAQLRQNEVGAPGIDLPRMTATSLAPGLL